MDCAVPLSFVSVAGAADTGIALQDRNMMFCNECRLQTGAHTSSSCVSVDTYHDAAKLHVQSQLQQLHECTDVAQHALFVSVKLPLHTDGATSLVSLTRIIHSLLD